MLKSISRFGAGAVRALRRSTRIFLGDRSGNVAMMWGLSIVPVLGFAGAAIDISQAVTVKTRLSQALDATGLAVARSVGLTEAEMAQLAVDYLNANYPVAEFGSVSTPSVSVTGNVVHVSAVATVRTTLMSIIGVHEMDVYAETEITRVTKGLEVALVLDNTGSMSSNGKMGALKTATLDLMEILFGPSVYYDDKLKISLVPFAYSVNIGEAGSFSMDWMDVDAEAEYHGSNFVHVNAAGDIDPNIQVNHFDLFDSTPNADWKGCVEMRPAPYDTLDTPPQISTPDTMFVPYFWPDEPDCRDGACGASAIGENVPNESSYRNRRFIDDEEFTKDAGAPKNAYQSFLDQVGYDGDFNLVDGDVKTWLASVDVTAANINDSEHVMRQFFPGVHEPATDTYTGKFDQNPSVVVSGEVISRGPNFGCPVPLTPLESDRNILEVAVDRMTPNGITYIPAGLAWGWRVLSHQAPFTEGVPSSDPEVTKAIILLTDGENFAGAANNHNNSRYAAYGYLSQERLGPGVTNASAGASALNSKVTTLCNEIKSDDIRVYTITFQVSGSVKDIFKDCATEPELYYDSPTNSELKTVFKAIAQDLSNLRISK